MMSLTHFSHAWRSAWLAVCGALSLACESDFESQMTLSSYRVIGIQANPPEVAPDAATALSVFEYEPDAAPVRHAWSVCLYSLGAAVGYACLDDALELALGTEPTAALDLGSNGLNLRARLAAYPDLTNEDGSTLSFARGFDVWVKLRSYPDCAGCKAIESVKRVMVREPSTEPPNRNPTISAFTVEGAPARGNTLALRVTVSNPELYTQPSTGVSRAEEYVFSWYSTERKADPTRSFGGITQTELKLPDEAGPVELFVAVHDGRGGLAVEHTTVAVE